MLLTISKEESKRVKDFLRKSNKDGLTDIIVRIYNDREYGSIKFQTSNISRNEYRDIRIGFETKNHYSSSYDEIVLDIDYDDVALDYLTSEEFFMEVYKNNNKGIRFEDENGNISDTKYFIDTVCLYKLNKKGYKEKRL